MKSILLKYLFVTAIVIPLSLSSVSADSASEAENVKTVDLPYEH
ncbi:hypothetical protein ACE1TI_15085 [Alteribacillus sp. JSM 102045]